MRCWLAACLVLALCAGASAQVFEHRGWKAYEVENDPDYGCRMAKYVDDDVHLVAYANGQEGFGVGLVKGSWNLPAGRIVSGAVTFDRIHTHMLEGQAGNPQLVMFYTGGEEGGLAAPFGGSRAVEIMVEGVQAKSSLEGSNRALRMLYECAERYSNCTYRGTAPVADGWDTFRLRGLSVDYPRFLVDVGRGHFRDGIEYGTAYDFEAGGAYMHAWIERTGRSPYGYARFSHDGDETYRVDRANVGVSSGYSGSDVYYTMCKRSAGELHCFRLVYPTTHRSMFDPMIERIARSLR